MSPGGAAWIRFAGTVLCLSQACKPHAYPCGFAAFLRRNPVAERAVLLDLELVADREQKQENQGCAQDVLRDLNHRAPGRNIKLLTALGDS